MKYKIKNNLTTKIIGNNIEYFEQLPSTNTYIKDNCKDMEEGHLVIAKNQTKGRGRRGNNWENSDLDQSSNIYMSVLLKPSEKIRNISIITLLVANSICNYFKKVNVNAKIKWPNDLELNSKKFCGILTEVNVNNKMIIGIGINVDKMIFSKELEEKATSLKKEGFFFNIEDLIPSILRAIEDDYYTFLHSGFKYFIESYRLNCINIGNTVEIIENGQSEIGTIQNVNLDGSLIFKKHTGEIKKIFAGEVSLRHKNIN